MENKKIITFKGICLFRVIVLKTTSKQLQNLLFIQLFFFYSECFFWTFSVEMLRFTVSSFQMLGYWSQLTGSGLDAVIWCQFLHWICKPGVNSLQLLSYLGGFLGFYFESDSSRWTGSWGKRETGNKGPMVGVKPRPLWEGLNFSKWRSTSTRWATGPRSEAHYQRPLYQNASGHSWTDLQPIRAKKLWCSLCLLRLEET